MKVQYGIINEGTFSSLKNKTTREDKLKSLKKDTLKIIMNDVLKEIPDKVRTLLTDLFEFKTRASRIMYERSSIFGINIHDFLDAEIENNKIILHFRAKFISSNGWASNGPVGMKISIYNLEYHNSILLAEAVCKELEKIYKEDNIQFDYKFIIDEELSNAELHNIDIHPIQRITATNTLPMDHCNFSKFIQDNLDIWFEKRDFDTVMYTALKKTFYANGAALTGFNSYECTLSIEGASLPDLLKSKLKAVQYILNLCNELPVKTRFTVHTFQSMQRCDIYALCEKMLGCSLDEYFDSKFFCHSGSHVPEIWVSPVAGFSSSNHTLAKEILFIPNDLQKHSDAKVIITFTHQNGVGGYVSGFKQIVGTYKTQEEALEDYHTYPVAAVTIAKREYQKIEPLLNYKKKPKIAPNEKVYHVHFTCLAKK